MNKLSILIKNYFNIFIGNINRKRNKNSLLSGTIFLLVIGALFLASFSFVSYTIILEAIESGTPEIAMYATSATNIMFLFMLVVIRGTTISKKNDYEMLLALPIKKITIILASLLNDIIFDFISMLLIMMPTYILYYILVPDTSFMIIINGLLLVFVFTLFAYAISKILNFLIYRCTYKLKKSKIIQTIINVTITIIFLCLYIFVNSSLNNTDSNFVNKFYDFPLFKIIVNFVLNNNYINLFLILLITLLPFCLSIILLVKTLDKQTYAYREVNTKLIYKQNNMMSKLVKNELTRYFESSLYVLNTILGGLFVMMLSILILIIGTSYLTNMLNLLFNNDYSNYINTVIVLLLVFVNSLTATTQMSISIEGKHIWILKAHPISTKSIFLSKIVLSLIINIIPVVVSSILLIFSLGISYFPFVLILYSLNAIFTAINGLYLNLKFPKLDWNSEEEIMKRGMSVLLGMVTDIIPSLILFITYFVVGMNNINCYLFLVIACLLYIIIDSIYYFILNTKGKKLFEKITA